MSGSCNKEGLDLTWTIENFSFLPLDDRKLETPKFRMEAFPKVEWWIELVFVPDGLTFSLKRISKRLEEETLCFTLLITVDGIEIVQKTGMLEYELFDNIDEICCIKREVIFSHGEHKSLMFRCNFWGHFSPKVPLKAYFSARTVIIKEHRSVVWTIPEFSVYKPNQPITFDVPPKWERSIPLQVILYFREEICTLRSLKVSILLPGENYSLLEVHGQITLSTSCGKEIATVKDERVFSTCITAPWDFRSFDAINSDEHFKGIFTYLPDNILNIRLEFDISHGNSFTWIENTIYKLYKPTAVSPTKIDEEFDSLKLNSLKDSGWRLKVADSLYSIHPEILCKKSPVFNAMLSGDVKDNTIEISDMEKDIVDILLGFMFYGKLDFKDWATTEKLYIASKKYQVSQLDHKCLVLLKNNLSSKNVCDILNLAHEHKDNDLQTAAENFIWNNLKFVLQSDEWEIFKQKNPRIACEALVNSCLRT